jgi:hypothetical protein
MVLTQLEMLAYVDGDELVIGAGVPPGWLERPLAVRGLVTEIGPVSWTWDGHNVKVRGSHALAAATIVVSREGCSLP